MPVIEVNGKRISFNISPYRAKKSPDYYKKIIMSSFATVGIYFDSINILYGGGNFPSSTDGWAQVEWNVNGQVFSYKSDLQPRMVDNLAAVAQIIEMDMKAIRRGLKNFNQVMSQFRLDYQSSKRTAREIIGVDASSKDWDYIQYKYKLKAKELHPDIEGGSEEKMQELNKAFEELKQELGK
jgi:hypothetical protein